jgi:hypothetical protein
VDFQQIILGVNWIRCAPKDRAVGAAGPQTPQNRNLKKKSTDFVDTISEVLRDLPFSRNQPLKSADDKNSLEFWKIN